jgi:hypothetical protein
MKISTYTHVRAEEVPIRLYERDPRDGTFDPSSSRAKVRFPCFQFYVIFYLVNFKIIYYSK